MATRRDAPGIPAGAWATIIALAVATSAVGCGPAPSPGRPGGPAPSVSRSSPTARVTSPPDVPALLLAVPAALAVTAPGRPLVRTAITMPPGAWQPTAAVGSHGIVLLASATTQSPASALEGALAGTRIEVQWRVSLPAQVGPAVLAGCVAPDGAATVIADRLVYVRQGHLAGTHELPATSGRCQMTDDGVVAYLADVDHALAFWRPGTDAAIVTATRCDDFGLGGGLLACLVAGDGEVVVGRLLEPVAGRPSFDTLSAQRVSGPARQVVLAPDGGWMALVGPDAGAVTLYQRLLGDTFDAVAASDLGASEALLGFVEP